MKERSVSLATRTRGSGINEQDRSFVRNEYSQLKEIEEKRKKGPKEEGKEVMVNRHRKRNVLRSDEGTGAYRLDNHDFQSFPFVRKNLA